MASDRSQVVIVCVEAGISTIPAIDTDSNYDKAGSDQHPINNIDWPQAKTYCEFVGRRLPSEWEWEWAARGRDEGRAYPWGDAPEPSCEHVVMDVGGFGCGENRSWPVGSKPLGQSRDGILDMAGNIWEWTADWYDNSQMARTVRGGCFSNKEISWLRTGHRSNDAPSSRYTSNGVRCVKTLNDSL